jgi:hypothetical protein
MRPTDFCHPNENDYPFAVRSRLSRTAFAARDAPQQSVAVALHYRGNERFHDARTASASNTSKRVVLVPSSSRLPVTSAGLFDLRRLLG